MKRRETYIKLNVPFNLPSVEQALFTQAITLEMLIQPGLPEDEAKRLMRKIETMRVYWRLFRQYKHYREIEIKMIKYAAKYEELTATQ